MNSADFIQIYILLYYPDFHLSYVDKPLYFSSGYFKTFLQNYIFTVLYLSVHFAPPIVHFAPPIVHFAPPIVHFAPPIVHSAPPIVHSAPPTVHFPRPRVHVASPIVSYVSG